LSTTKNLLFGVGHGTRRQHKGCCFEFGSFLILQEYNFGRGDGLERVIQFWKIQANGLAIRRFCSQRNLANVINYAR
jgi:hypothetical protein